MNQKNNHKNEFLIRDYQRKPPFSSFLPGIASPMGIPVWVYYNNRGQGVCSFGAQDKNHAIQEFCPAHMAYQNNARTGFRTFLKIDGAYLEALKGQADMQISSAELVVSGNTGGMDVSAVYFGVPGERAGMLARILTVENHTSQAHELEVLDGLPAVVPFGINNDCLKNMTQLSKAWMQVEQLETGRPCFCVRASMEDSAQVTQVHGGNFAFGMTENGKNLAPIVQPELIFGEDTSLECPEGFLHSNIDELLRIEQVTENEFPCCFFPEQRVLLPGEYLQICSLFGQTEEKSTIDKLTGHIRTPSWFQEKREEASRLVEELTDVVDTRTSDSVFDSYCRQTYLDNLLRGGTPVFFRDGEKQMPFYLYSRKHGDPEREYNAFSLGNEYYAQGNGNFRDVCQNRRCDVFFHPQLQDFGIRMFFELIQSDGYNPLVLTYSTFHMEQAEAGIAVSMLPESERETALALLTGEFTPGRLAMFAQDCGLERDAIADFLNQCVSHAICDPNADFTEGYWSDHWTYLQDLVDQYLAVYPEKKQTLLFGARDLRWYETRTFVNPRCKRYEQTDHGLRQYHALDDTHKKATVKWMQTAAGKTAYSSLAEKMVVLCTLKAATIDAAGMGIEMEGGKPGWYDALNGLPGLLGSSMAETCELVRTLRFLIQVLQGQPGELIFYEEMAQLIGQVKGVYLEAETPYARWDGVNRVKEAYREITKNGVAGACRALRCSDLADALAVFEKTLQEGITEAVRQGGGICPTYFSYEAEKIRQVPGGILPGKLTPQVFPLFLEGPVHWLKLGQIAGGSDDLQVTGKQKAEMVRQIRESDLYDRKLQMYKVNASLQGVSYEAGRALAFTPGWLENESVWLHMEYKYLLELLRSGLYTQFEEAFLKAAVPFLDPEVYGRSTLENVSFLASSANPNPAVHGRGFVARLSGSTAEFTEIWKLMFFGGQNFTCDRDGTLRLTFKPYLPAWLIPESGEVSAVFLGKTRVTYHTDSKESIVPGHSEAVMHELIDTAGKVFVCEGNSVTGELAHQVRDGRFSEIHIELAEK